MATTIPGGIYMDADGNLRDANGKPVSRSSEDKPVVQLDTSPTAPKKGGTA